MNDEQTIGKILEQLKEPIPDIKEGMVLEVLSSIYPTSDEFTKEERNINYDGKRLTKPLACTAKDKRCFIKENSPLKDFFIEFNRGDFLKIEKIEDGKVKCRNISMNKIILEQYYNNELIELKESDLLNGLVKPFKKSIKKFFNKNK